MCEVNGFAPQPHRHCGLAKPLIWIFWAPFISYFLLALKESTKQYKSKIYCRIIAMNAEISRVSQKGHHPFLKKKSPEKTTLPFLSARYTGPYWRHQKGRGSLLFRFARAPGIIRLVLL